VSVLLGQADGFEGRSDFGDAKAHLHPRQLAIAKFPQTGEAIANPNIASGHWTREMPQSNDLLAAVIELVDLQSPIAQPLPLLSQHSGERVDATPSARLNRGGGVDELVFRITEGKQLLEVLAVPGVYRTANRVHVLLRHRPRSIPQAQESA
jgi:hypothetical protein